MVSDIFQLRDDLVTANRILADNDVLDLFGHVTIRHPDNPERFLMSRARAPMCVEMGDIMEFTLDGKVVGPEPGKPYSERFIHGAIYEARPDVMSVVHNHSPSVVPFSIMKKQCFCAVMHMAAPIAATFPTGTFAINSATAPTCWSPAWRWDATWPNRSATARWP